MLTMQVTASNNAQITKNFAVSDYYSKSFNAPTSHFIDDRLPLLVQIVRDFYNVPVVINSSFRTKEHNALVGGSKNSQHLKGTAVDWTFPKDKANMIARFSADIRKGGPLLQKLRANGLGGIGLYNTFIHFDVRSTGLQKDSFGSFAFWDNSKKKANS